MKISCKNIQFSYPQQKTLIRNLNLDVSSGEKLWIQGRSGSGKSSFLKLLAGLLAPSQGEVQIQDTNFSRLSDLEKRKFRFEHIGYTHQENHLIDHWTLEQNLAVLTEDSALISEILTAVDLPKELSKSRVGDLSGGEKQRLSLARLIIQKPKIALIDEPTSHLDDENTEKLMTYLLRKLKDSTFIVVSHDHRLEKFPLKTLQFSELNP